MTYYERRLPHWQPEGKILFVTWRLWGSLPAAAWTKLRAPVDRRAALAAKARGQSRSFGSPRHHVSAGAYFAALDQALERAPGGPRWLKDERVAGAVVEALRKGDRELAHYHLHAFVVMPNHVHALLEPLIPPVLSLKTIKGTAARSANTILGRTGRPFWQEESFDHWVRSGAEFERIRSYIERNPVRAGLATKPQDWPWSSACQP